MIVSSCPLRVSLVGGSTDHPYFIERYGHGSVISFASNLRTYVTLHEDVFGVNAIENSYNISYSKRETVKEISAIRNEMVRHCLEYLAVKHINCSLVSDVFSAGSGLASSSSYLQALIKAIFVWRGQTITEFGVCKIAEQIERKFNPLVGQQDFFGSTGGFKRINFFKDKDPVIRYLDESIFETMDTYLLYTGIVRNSTSVLETLETEKSLPLISDVDDLEHAINSCNINLFNEIMKRSWHNKKLTSRLICENQTLVDLDKDLSMNSNVYSHKLCGAGNGGYFLVFTKKNTQLSNDYPYCRRISISETGLKYINLSNEFTRV